jgi:PAS domain S-box-containing protein
MEIYMEPVNTYGEKNKDVYMPNAGESTTEFDYFEALFYYTKRNSVLLMDDKGFIKNANETFLKTFGYNLEDILNKYTGVLFTEEDRLIGKPEQEIEQVLRDGQSMDNNYLVHKNGTYTWVSGESLILKSDKGGKSILKIIQDIQQQKLSEAAITRLHEFNESILAGIEDAVLVLDNKMTIIKTNKSLKGLFNKTTIDGSPNFSALIGPYDIENKLLNKIHACFHSKQSFSKTEIEIETMGAGKRIYSVSCCSIHPTSNKEQVLVVLQNITEQKQAEREREDIIGFVAHELRNPLANIVLCNEILRDAIVSNNTGEMNDMLERSKNNVMRLNKMIAELYDATKAYAGNLRLEAEAFNFQDMVKEAVDTVKGLQPFYNIMVKGNGNLLVYADKFRIIQVVVNFLSNGIKYSNGNNVVMLTIEHNDESVTLSVKDEGLGISKSQLPYIFERFFRAERTRNLEGIGLGLYLCRQIINAHNGKIWAESEEGKGSVFYFSIPIKQVTGQND